jgi:transposase-like protein
VPISDICNQEKLQPSVFYDWLKKLLDNAPIALAAAKGSTSEEQALSKKVEALEERVKKKDEVIAEISEEFVRLRKELGEP